MIHTVFIIALTLNFFGSQAQFERTFRVSSDSVRGFKNQGEQEDDRTKVFFEENYSSQNFKEYDSTIIVSGDTVKYSDKYFVVWTAGKFKTIFSNGIFYPTIIAGNSKLDCRLTISNFEELTFLNHSPN